MPSSKSTDKKVSVSFTNWVLGGSLVSLSSTESERRHPSITGRKVVISDANSNDDEITVKEVENPKIGKKSKKKEGDGGEKKDEVKKKDGDAEKDKGKKCKCCGEDKGSGEGGGKKNGGTDKAKTDGGDGEKKAEEKKCDEPKEKSDNSGSGGDKGGGHSGWTEAQDNKIKEMKGAGKSWKEIALEVGASKNDVTKRFKELNKTGDEKSGDSLGRSRSNGWDNGGAAADSGGQSNAGNNGGGSGDSGTQSNGWKNGGGTTADTSGQSNGWDKGGGAEDFSGGSQSNGWDKGRAADAGIGMDFGADLFDEPAKEPEKSSDTVTGGWGNISAQDSPKSNNNTTNNWNDGGKNQKGNKEKGYWNADSEDQNTGGSGWDNGTGNSKQSQRDNDGGGWDKYDSNQSSKPQEQHSGGMGRLQPNEIWSREDCEVLEMLAHRYKEYKWLHIKAGFFNWTGRMISDEMIQQKFQDDGWD